MTTNHPFLKYEEKVLPQAKKRKVPTEVDSIAKTLNSLFPPIEIDDDGKTKIITVSTKQATRFDILDLQRDFKAKLEELEAVDNDIFYSKDRNKLYDQLFDELVRQEIVRCKDRGMLFRKIQEECKLSLEVMWKLIRSSYSYGVCKSSQMRYSILSDTNALKNFTARLKTAQERIETLKEELEKQKIDESREDEVRTITQQIVEENLMEENKNMEEQLEKLADPEGRWYQDR